jgi:AbrB family looped-hinge helix DNA binding protein
METVTLSSKFQIVIPTAVRQALDITPGQKMQVLVYRNRLELIPLKPMSALRGQSTGIDTTVEREADRL